MRRLPWKTLLVQALLLGLLAWVVSVPRVPLGVRGEWEWGRMPFETVWRDVGLALLGVLLYAGFVAWGASAIARRAGRLREAAWMTALLAGSVFVQVVVPSGAPEGFGLAKWAMALHNPATTGYYTVARIGISNSSRFLTNYAGWLRRQIVPRFGGHPPGLFVLTHETCALTQANPALARGVTACMPDSVDLGFQELSKYGSMPRSDRAALVLIGALTLLVCAATVIPLYLLARATLPPATAWAAAALWPLVPAALMFQPTADTAYPFLSTAALACAAGSGRGRAGLFLAFLAGVILALGLIFSLVFLAVGLTVGLVLISLPSQPLRRRIGLVLATGAGFLAVTFAVWAIWRLNLPEVWVLNRHYHKEFYKLFPRSYAKWVLVDLAEFAVGLGIPAVVWAVRGFSWTSTPRAAWATLAVLLLLNFGGLSLSEVGRLWLPWAPSLLLASACGMARTPRPPIALAATVTLLGIQTLMLQVTIQVVYPM